VTTQEGTNGSVRCDDHLLPRSKRLQRNSVVSAYFCQVVDFRTCVAKPTRPPDPLTRGRADPDSPQTNGALRSS
jgi:hypothetical protein